MQKYVEMLINLEQEGKEKEIFDILNHVSSKNLSHIHSITHTILKERENRSNNEQFNQIMNAFSIENDRKNPIKKFSYKCPCGAANYPMVAQTKEELMPCIYCDGLGYVTLKIPEEYLCQLQPKE